MSEETTELLRRALHHAEAFIESLPTRPVGTTAGFREIRDKLHRGLSDRGVPGTRVLDELVRDADGGLLNCAGGRFFAWVVGGALPSALAADWLTSVWDQNAALSAVSPAAAVVEEVVGDWLRDVLGLPEGSSFAITTGCQLAHFTALSAARLSVLERAGWDVNTDGLCGAPEIRVFVSEERHRSVDRAVRFLGMGTRSLIPLETDDEGRIAPDAFKQELRKSEKPTILVLDAADLNIAAFDSFRELIPVARASGAWVHVDGAFGLFARVSEKKRHLVVGVEAADSWAADAHKWLNVPFDCGLAFVRDSRVHREAMTIGASYIASDGEVRDPIDWNPEWSRRARGFALYAAMRELGRDGLRDLIDRTCRHAEVLVDGLGALRGADVIWRPHLNQGLIRFLDPRAKAEERDHDVRTDAVIQAINESGEAFFSGTTWRGRRAMRVSVVNWRTTEEDVARTIAAAAKVLNA